MEQNGLGGGKHLKSKYIREGFLYYDVMEEEEYQEDYRIKMLVNNQIEGLLPYEYRGEGKNYYLIEGHKNMDILGEKEHMAQTNIKTVFTSLFHLLHELEYYLLPEDGVVIMPQHIFFNSARTSVFYCYNPLGGRDIMVQLTEFVEYLMNHIDHQEEKLVVFVYGIYRLIREEFVSLDTIEEYVCGFQWEHSVPKVSPIEKKVDKMEPTGFMVKEEGTYGVNIVKREEKKVACASSRIPSRESLLDIVRRKCKKRM